MSIRIVTHCYAGALPQYAYFLKAQLWSIEQFAPKDTKISVCCSPGDGLTCDVLAQYREPLKGQLFILFLAEQELFNRSIGRNIVALRQKEDIVWFTDVDHVFLGDCLTSLQMQMLNAEWGIYFAKYIKIHKYHQIGDSYWKTIRDEGNFFVDENDFETKKYNRAIGGVQIVPGDMARKHGYLNDQPQFRRPTDGKKPFPSFKDDVRYRAACVNRYKAQALKLPNLYRLRHTETTYQ